MKILSAVALLISVISVLSKTVNERMLQSSACANIIDCYYCQEVYLKNGNCQWANGACAASFSGT